MKKSIVFLVKIIIPLAITLFFGSTFLRMTDRYKVAKVEAEFSQLGYIMPRSFDYFVSKIEKDRNFDPEKLNEFIGYYEKVTELLPRKADAFGILGFCYYYAQEKGKAIKSYQRAIELNPHFFWFYYNLGSIYFEMRQYDKAIASFKKALEQSLESALLFIRYSTRIYQPILVRRSDYSDGFLSKIKEQNSQECYAFIVLSYYHLKKYDETINIANYAAGLYPDKKDKEFYYYYMGLSLFEQKEFRKAFFFFEKVISINPDNAEALYILGVITKSLGKGEIALKYMATSKYLIARKKAKALKDIKVRLESF